jgi:hypothetical protein
MGSRTLGQLDFSFGKSIPEFLSSGDSPSRRRFPHRRGTLPRHSGTLFAGCLVLCAIVAVSELATATASTHGSGPAGPATTKGSLDPISLVPLTLSRHSGGGLDCNGYSPISSNVLPYGVCAPPSGPWGGRYYDNGHYVGQDEASVEFLSNAPGSADNLQWSVVLPSHEPSPTQNGSNVSDFELYSSFWFSMALCDPSSYPINPCTPDNDSNIGGPYPALPNAAGSASLELDFFPPDGPYCGFGLDGWCAQMNIFSFESTYDEQFVNSNCEEPFNSAFVQTNGLPTGPPGPGQQNSSTFLPNAETLVMSPADRILVTIKDTTAGLYTGVTDLTSGKTGYMVASAANGFLHTNVTTCATTPFSFHPEFATATAGHVSSWTENYDNVNLAFELGHFELGTGDNDSDDSGPCQLYDGIQGCYSRQDSDFDGPSYQFDWPNGSAQFPGPLILSAPTGNGVGPMSYVSGAGYGEGYASFQFSTIAEFANSNCNLSTGVGCALPPNGSPFYPFYSTGSAGNSCVMEFGNDTPGVTTNDFGRDSEYGPGSGLHNGSILANPCLPTSSQVYPVTFSETGLPTGTGWSVTLDGSSLSSASSTITFTEPNGSYSYTVGPVSGYELNPSSGTAIVNGSNEDLEVTFVAVAASHAVTFEETGLPSGTTWSVTLNGVTKSASTNAINFPQPNGTYAYTIGNVAGWHQTTLPYAGSVTVNGVAVTEPTLAFLQVTYTVTFTESGLPSGTTWSVKLGGSTRSSTTSTITFSEPNGTYAYLIGPVSGYTVTQQSGSTVVIEANPSTVSMSFAPVSTSSSSSTWPSWIYAVIGVVIVVVVFGVAISWLRQRRPPSATNSSPPPPPP